MTSEIRANIIKNRVGLGTIEYSDTGPIISGVTTALNFKTGTSNLHNTGLNVQDLDVDGHTNLDNVSVAGVSTFTGQARFNGEIVAANVISVQSGGSINIPDKLIHSGDTNTAIRFPAADTFSVETGGVQRLQLDATEAFFNSTGANTDFRVRSPAQGHLFFVDAGNDQVTIKTSSAQSGAVLTVNGRTHLEQLTLGNNSTLDGGAQATIYKPATNTLAFATAGANERLRITSGGHVNIGNSLTQTTRLFTAETTYASGGEVAYIGNNDGSNNYGGLVISAGEIDRECRLESAWGNSFFTFHTQSDGAGAGERLRIAPNGKVGIGTNNPSFFTHIQADGVSGDVLKLSATTSGQMMNIQNKAGSSVPAIVRFVSHNGSGFWDLQYNNNDNSFSFDKNDGEKVRILSNGNFGIGTNNPSQKLEVIGTTSLFGSGAASCQWGDTSYIGHLSYSSDGAIVRAASSKALIFHTNHVNERLRITSDGDTELRNTVSGINNSYSQYLKFRTTQTNGQSAVTGQIAGQGKSGWGGDLVFYSKPANSTPNDSLTERVRITSSGQLLLGETSAFDSNVAMQFRKDNAGSQSRFIFRNRGNNGSSRVRLIMSTLNRAANADIFSGMEQYQSGGMAIFNGQSDTSHCNISIFAGNWQPMTLRNGNVSGQDPVHIRGYWGTSNGLHIEQGGPQSGTFKAVRFTTSHYGGERGYIGVTLGGTSYNNSSDYRMKQDIVDLTGAIDRVKSFKPKRFKWKEDPTYTVDGFLAHEASTVVPESVTGEKDAVDRNGDPEYQVIDQSKLIPVLTAALKEAIAKIEILETKVAALESS